MPKTDALKRLEGWLKKGVARQAIIDLCVGGDVGVMLVYHRMGTMLKAPAIRKSRKGTAPAAIHAALDQAEGRR